MYKLLTNKNIKRTTLKNNPIKNSNNNSNNKEKENQDKFQEITISKKDIENQEIIDFTKIVYINLNIRKDRNKICQNFYNKQNLNVERFPAIATTLQKFKSNYPYLDTTYFEQYFLPKHNTKWINGTLGCYSSHYEILNMYKDNIEFKYLIVLEDDCLVPKDIIISAIKFYDENPHIDILRLNSWNKYIMEKSNPSYQVDFITKHSKMISKNENITYQDGGTHICIYHYSKIRTIIDFMNNENVFQVDALFNNDNINSFWLKFDYNIKYQSKSDIQDLDSLFNINLLKKLK